MHMTAYEMRISDWSSDVCSSDLFNPRLLKPYVHGLAHFHQWCARWLLGIRLKVEGTLPAEHVLVAAKHESAYETIALIGLLNEPVIVLKADRKSTRLNSRH